MRTVLVALDGCLLQGAVHPLDLAIGPGMVGFGQTVLDIILAANPIE